MYIQFSDMQKIDLKTIVAGIQEYNVRSPCNLPFAKNGPYSSRVDLMYVLRDLPLSLASIRYSNQFPLTLTLSLMSSALYKIEKSPFSVGRLWFLFLTLLAVHVLV